MDLVHRDSPKSPLYNHSLTPSQCVATALNRPLQWYDYFKSGLASIIPNHGEFLMKLSFGKPPVEMLVIVDTGSDLTWIQCEPCTNCFKQNFTIFSPNKSSTYKVIPFTSGVFLDWFA